MRSMFRGRGSATSYSLRDTECKLAIPMPRTNYLEDSFDYSGAVLWNSLPVELRAKKLVNHIRAGCKKYFYVLNVCFICFIKHAVLMESRVFFYRVRTSSELKNPGFSRAVFPFFPGFFQGS